MRWWDSHSQHVGNTSTGRAPFSMRSWRMFHDDWDLSERHESRLADFMRKIGRHLPPDPADWRLAPGYSGPNGHNKVVGRLTHGQKKWWDQ